MFPGTSRLFSRIPSLLVLIAAIVGAGPLQASCTQNPTVTVVYAGGNLSIGYSFPDTTSATQRSIAIYLDGKAYPNYYATTSPGTVSGTWIRALPTACWTTGEHAVRVTAVSCGSRRADAFTSVTANSTPDVSVDLIGPDANSQATVSVTYNFPNTTSSGQRDVKLYLDGTAWPNYFAQINPTAMSGTWNVPRNVACWTTGTHSIRATAQACAPNPDLSFRKDDFVDVAVDTTPSISASFIGPDAAGNGSLSIDYDFPNTTSPDDRDIAVYLDDTTWPNTFALKTSSQTRSGNWTIPVNTACWSQGQHFFRIVGRACQAQDDPSFLTTIFTNLAVDHTPAAALTVNKASPQSPWQAVVDYDFPETASSAQRSLRLEWLPSGTVIGDLHPTARSGQWVVTLPACSVGTNEMIRVTATACGTVSVTDQAPVILPSCEVACSIECPDCVGKPIRITSGNMRLSDSDPLPAGDLGALKRTFDSKGTPGVFGKGWTSVFDARATIRGGSDNRETVFLVTESGDRYFFVRDTGGSTYRQTYPAGERRPTILTYDAGRDVFIQRGGASSIVRIFRGSDGRLSAIRHVSRIEETVIGYDANGLPISVQDGEGRWVWTITINAAGRIDTVAVDGQPELTWTYTYDGQGNLLSVANPSGIWRTYTYGVSGIQEARDGAGRLIEGHQYDAAGNAITSTGASDDITAVAYDLPGRVAGETLTRVTAASGRTTDYYSRLIAGKMRTVEVDGSCDCGTEDSVFAYDSAGHIVREQNARGLTTNRVFDDWRLVEEVTSLRPLVCDPSSDAALCRLTPDLLQSVMLTSTEATFRTSFVYGDPNWPDRATAIFTASVRNPEEQKRQEYVFDATTGDVLIDSLAGWTGTPAVEETHTTTTALYDGSETAAFDPGGAFSAWSSLPQPIRARKSVDGPRQDVTDITTFVHYPQSSLVPALLRGRLAAVRDPLGAVTRYESYNLFGSPTRVVDDNGVATEWTYDMLGRLLTTTAKAVPGCDTAADPLCSQDITIQRTYAANNGPLSIEERPEGVTVYTYDNRGRMLTLSRGPSVSDLRERTEYEYDTTTGEKTLARILGYENGSWVETRRQSEVHDEFGRTTQVVNADASSTGYAYQAGGLVTSVRDENHTTPNTFYEYDPAGRLAVARQTLGGGVIETTYGYDLHGNLTSVSDPNGNVTSYLYDDFGQMLEQTSPVTGVTKYQYDLGGNLVTTTDANEATTIRAYDARGRVTSAISSRSGTTTETVTWSYGDTSAAPFLRNRLMTMADPTGSTTYQYNRRGLLAREQKTVDQATYATAFTYDANGNRATITYPSGRVVTYTHDYAGRPLSLTADGTTIVGSASYLPFGPTKQLVFGNGTTQTFTRDNRYMPQSNLLTGTATLADYDYGHDPAGNIIRIDDLQDAGWNRTFAYDDLNRLVTVNGGANLWGLGGYTYDAMGNMLSATLGTWRTASFSMTGTGPRIASATENGEQRAVTYDAAGNELTVGTDASTHSARNQVLTAAAVVYQYDGRGVRTITTTGTPHRYSLYTPELNLLAETESNTSATPAITYEYLWFAGQPVAQIETATGAISWYVNDHLGTPILQTDPAGQIIWRAEYEPYGSTFALRAGSALHQPLRFPGQENDGGADQSYNIFRWYRAGWGRYTQADPISLASGMNLYSYGLWNPISNVDPSGLVTWTQNAPVYHGANWDTVSKNCDKWSALGCTLANAKGWCKCSCVEGSYVAKVTLTMSPVVWARNDHPKAPLMQIVYEENKHVQYAKVTFKWAVKRGEALEGNEYSSKKDCDAACQNYLDMTANDFGSDWVHENNPHPF